MHNVTEAQTGPLLSYAVQAWYNDPYARGAFALFGPGQFGSTELSGEVKGFSMFASLKAPAAGGRLHFAGEATSIHHAWVVGALNSAWRAVFDIVIWDESVWDRFMSEDFMTRYPRPAEEDLYNQMMVAASGIAGAI